MFAPWTDILLPPADLLVLAVIGWLVLRSRPRTGRALLLVSLIGLYVLSLTPVSTALLAAISLPNSNAKGAQAIVVLGAGMREKAPEYGGPAPDGLTLERVRYAARLARATGLPVALSGGAPIREGPPVARVMEAVLRADYGLYPRWIETASHTTAENARETMALLTTAGIRRIYLVTHAWHMARASLAFERAGAQVIAMGTGLPEPQQVNFKSLIPSARALQGSYYAFHEIIGLAWYALILHDDRSRGWAPASGRASAPDAIFVRACQCPWSKAQSSHR
jgi:uncharacterized SAM-binding protein YcdF (DUF218 family)